MILLILGGVGLLVFPLAANYLYAKNASNLVQNFDELIKQTDEEQLAQALAEAIAYNNALEGNPVKDPFLKGSGMAMAENYSQVLNLGGSGVMGYVTIPKIGIMLPVYHGTSEETLQQGIGHLEGSSLPVGGETTHSVLTGHTGLARAKMFTDLTRVTEDDIFYLHILDQTLAYKVDQIKIVLPEDTTDLQRAHGQDYCTLITCYPYGVNSHRLLVRGVRIEYVPEIEEEQIRGIRSSAQWFSGMNLLPGLALGVAAALVIILTLTCMRKKRGERKIRWWDEIEKPGKEKD